MDGGLASSRAVISIAIDCVGAADVLFDVLHAPVAGIAGEAFPSFIPSRTMYHPAYTSVCALLYTAFCGLLSANKALLVVWFPAVPCMFIVGHRSTRAWTGRTQVTYLSRRRLAAAEVPYVVTVPGITTQGMVQSINHFQANYMEVSSSLGVPGDEVSFLSCTACLYVEAMCNCFFRWEPAWSVLKGMEHSGGSLRASYFVPCTPPPSHYPNNTETRTNESEIFDILHESFFDIMDATATTA